MRNQLSYNEKKKDTTFLGLKSLESDIEGDLTNVSITAAKE